MLIQFVLIGILAIALLMTWRRAHQGVIRWTEALFWSVLWIGAGIVTVLPQSTSIIAHAFGVGRGVDLVIYASITLLFVMVFKIYLTLDRLEKKLTDVVRDEALRDLPDKKV